MSQFAIKDNIERYQSFVLRANIVRFTNLLRTTVDEGNRRMVAALLAEARAKLRTLSPEEGEDGADSSGAGSLRKAKSSRQNKGTSEK